MKHKNCYIITTTTVNCHESVLELCTFNRQKRAKKKKYVEHKNDPLDLF